MIKIKKVTCRNFLSYGNTPTEFILDQHRATLIRGRNGRGKSVLLDLLLYSLYGKPYRAINKPQLVNSINAGELLVELELNVGGSEYIIRRGMKPSIFDIIKDGVLVEQDAASRDYQDFFETQILKVSERTFKQIAVLGSASYVPFMQLASGQRRELIESILDIDIFSKMNVVLKDRISSTKEEYKGVTHKVDLKKSEAISQQKLIAVMTDNTNARVAEYENQRATLLLEQARVDGSINALTCDCAQLKQKAPAFDLEKYESTSLHISHLSGDISAVKKKLKSIHSIDECPSCLQAVTVGHVAQVGVTMQARIGELQKELELFEVEQKAMTTQRDALYEHQAGVDVITNKLLEEHKELGYIHKQIAAIDVSIDSVLKNTDNVLAEQDRLKALAAEAIGLIARKNKLSEEKHIQEVAQQLLKDTGIKTAVVREYLPILNQLINKYLAMFDFFVDFNLNENFEEVIRSRGRDIYSYASFSEGEKQRINLSVLLAFRQLAALKNSAKTNILILDEILDSNLDLAAIEQARDIILGLADTNVTVISHSDVSEEGFSRVLVIDKVGDFSSIRE